MYKILIINHTFGREDFRKRWKMLAQQHPDFDVTLIGPRERTYGKDKDLTLGKLRSYNLEEINEGNYHVIPVELQYHRYRTWTSRDMVNVIKQLQPDLLFHIGVHFQDSLMQCIDCVRKYVPGCKIVTFSMRGPNMNIFERGHRTLKQYVLKILETGPKVLKVNKFSDAVFCHYPDAVTSFKKEGFKRPIYIQTQCGVDPEVYYPDVEKRRITRERYNLGDSFVFGSASRFAPDKGIDDILDALPKDGNWKYLMMGGGLPEEEDRVKKHIKQLGIEDKVIVTGPIEQAEMSAHWNAVDCAVHVPRTSVSSDWVETFSLALVQAMATNIPVIGDTSGSVPYQIGPEGIIVREGDIKAIGEKMVWIMNNPDDAQKIGNAMRWRAVNCFGIQHLDDCVYDIFKDIINGEYDEMKFDMASYKVPVRK